ncbi:glycosyltransferase [Bdellovibrio sp. KM01]|uniref:glycosyltransferase n=1 Tax=Bdellovibrio sp. KM01 TaxID=2748865 RepID=UPI0015E93C52|nr:glycosyltransferase [Bdellovibrio sp. KM01]QLY27029.1 glycosyltransferase [Bdellovibrio sp. KM01]
MKHIVFLAEHLSFGGAERALVEILNHIDTQKYKVTLIIRDDFGEDNYLLKLVPNAVQVMFLYKKEEKYINKKNLNCFQRFHNYLRKKFPKYDLKIRFDEAFDLIGHIDLIIDFTSVLIKQAYYFRRYRKVYWIHGPKTHMDRIELAKFGMRLRSYDLVAAVSGHLKAEVEQLIPRLRGHVVTLYNPFDFSRIASSSVDETELSPDDLKLLNERYILAVGRFALEKDYQNLIKAFQILKSEGVNYKLFIIGDGTEKGNVEEFIKKNDMANDVILLGRRKNPYIWMKHSILFVHSANVEGFGLVIVEAMALGKAVVVTDSPVGPREILSNGDYGVLVPPKNPVAMAEGIRKLIKDPGLMNEYQEKSLQRAGQYSTDSVMPELYKMIDSLV